MSFCLNELPGAKRRNKDLEPENIRSNKLLAEQVFDNDLIGNAPWEIWQALPQKTLWHRNDPPGTASNRHCYDQHISTRHGRSARV